MLRQILNRRILFTIIMAAVLSGFVFSTTLLNNQAGARPCNSILKEYYSDATYSTQIGEQYWPCIGQPSQWGTTSEFKIVSLEQCGGACGSLP